MKVAIVLYDGFTATDAMGPYRVFDRAPGFDVSFVATEPGVVVADNGVTRVRVEQGLTDVPAPDLVLVPGAMAGFLAAMQDQPLLGWLRRQYDEGRVVTSVCTGALIVGAAGLLVGREACTHWSARPMLRQVGARPVARRFVPGERIYTAAGVSAGVDLALHLVAELGPGEDAPAVAWSAGVAPSRWLGHGTPEQAGWGRVLGAAYVMMVAHPGMPRFLRSHRLRFWWGWLKACVRRFGVMEGGRA